MTHDCISQRDKITNGGTRPEVLQVRSRGTVRTTLIEIFELLFSRIHQRVQFLEVLIVEPSRNGLVDISEYRVVPVYRVLCSVIENVDLSGASDETLWLNHSWRQESGRTMCAPLHEGPKL